MPDATNLVDGKGVVVDIILFDLMVYMNDCDVPMLDAQVLALATVAFEHDLHLKESESEQHRQQQRTTSGGLEVTAVEGDNGWPNDAKLDAAESNLVIFAVDNETFRAIRANVETGLVCVAHVVVNCCLLFALVVCVAVVVASIALAIDCIAVIVVALVVVICFAVAICVVVLAIGVALVACVFAAAICIVGVVVCVAIVVS